MPSRDQVTLLPESWAASARARLGDASALALAGGITFFVAGGLGIVSYLFGSWALLVGVVIFCFGLASTDISLLPVLAFPAVLLPIRTGPLSLTDLVLIASTLPALLLYRREEAKDLQPLIWLGIAYQACLIPTVLLNPYLANAIEWGHELVMVLGGLVVGWVVGRTGHASIALRLYVIGSCVIGVWAFAQGLVMLAQHGTFGPVYLPIYHKNFIGNMLVFALIIAYMRPDWLGWSRRFSYPAIAACAIGIAASGARQAMVSLAVAIVVMSLRPKQGGGGRGRILLLAITPGLWFVFNSVSDQIDDFSQGDRFNSTAQRLVWFSQSLDIWRQSPLFGVGLRWWYTGRFEGAAFQPPNALFEMLSSAGIIGTLGFLVLCLGALWVLLTLPPKYGNLATAIMVARFTQGQLDLYWIAGASSLPWMMAGLVIGVRAADASRGIPGATLQPPTRAARTRLGTLPASRFVRHSQSPPYVGVRFKSSNDSRRGGP